MLITIVLSVSSVAYLGQHSYQEHGRRIELYDRWKALVDIVPAAILLVDLEGKIVDQNKGANDLIGHRLNGDSIIDLMSDDSVKLKHKDLLMDSVPMAKQVAHIVTPQGDREVSIEVIPIQVDGAKTWLVFIDPGVVDRGGLRDRMNDAIEHRRDELAARP